MPLRIVLVLNEPPLPFGGAAARWYYVLLRELARRGHRVTAFAGCATAAGADEALRVFPPGAYDLRCYPHSAGGGLRSKCETLFRPYSYVFSGRLRRDLDRELARGFDVLHLEQLWSGWLGRPYAERAVVNVHYLYRIDWSLPPAGPVGGIEWLRRANALRAEAQLLRAFRHVTTLTPRLTEHVRRVSPRADARTVPMALDLSAYDFGRPGGDTDRPPTVGLVGSFGWGPSRTAGERLVTRLWPKIREAVPGARLLVVGRGARAAFGGYGGVPGLTLASDVPDALPYFRGLDVMLYAPDVGSGMKVKVLEAFALGTPVVTNADGVEGLGAEDGVHAGVCAADDGLVARTVRLLRCPEQRDRQREAARRLVEGQCDREAVGRRLEDSYRRILSGPAVQRGAEV